MDICEARTRVKMRAVGEVNGIKGKVHYCVTDRL